MSKPYLRLQHSESIVIHAASRIYAAYITAGRGRGGGEDQWLERSLEEAVRLAVRADDHIDSDEEMR